MVLYARKLFVCDFSVLLVDVSKEKDIVAGTFGDLKNLSTSLVSIGKSEKKKKDSQKYFQSPHIGEVGEEHIRREVLLYRCFSHFFLK